MPRIDPWEADVMADCQKGTDMSNGFWTGSVCRDRAACREDGRCYFVTRVEHYREKHGGMPTGEPVYPERQRTARPLRLQRGRPPEQQTLPGMEAA